MELKFTFQSASDSSARTPQSDGAGLPFNVSPAASTLAIHLTASDTSVTARAISGDGVEYARVDRPRRPQDDDFTPLRSALARVMAEVGEPANRSLQALHVSPDVHDTLVSAGAVDTSGTFSSEDLQTRTAIPSGTELIVTDQPGA